MTRFLKLVRHQNGNWQALPCDSDELAPVTFARNKNAPIDPVQLLKALAPLLSSDGGIKSTEEVARLSSLMKKFSKKLVSRCVYCNVLSATKPEILTVFLDENGWGTINTWLQDAKDNGNSSFLLELLKLCKVLPMTVDRLKQNNTAKIIKALTKYDNDEVKVLACELVTLWMTIIKGEKGGDNSIADKDKKKKKKDKTSKEDKEQKDPKRLEKESGKEVGKVKSRQRDSKDKDETSMSEIYEDVKIDPEPLIKKPRSDRPKTVKTYQTRFRATGLEEENPLPKNISKKTPTVDKTVAAAAAKTAVKRLNTSLPERTNEKKIKPESLITTAESSNAGGGIKLIPAKPRPAHILHESASFMDALVAQPTQPPKRKKKVQVNKPPTPTTPPSPTLAPPKLQFYKDTLDMSNEEESEETNDKQERKVVDEEHDAGPPDITKEGPMEDSDEHLPDENPATPVDDTVEIDENMNLEKAKDTESSVEGMEEKTLNPAHLRSILAHGKRRDKKKSVRWVEESILKQVHYFDLDETERVNVHHIHNFGDLKSLEMKRERQAFEAARRLMGDKMEEIIPWWREPIVIDLPPPLLEPGCNSKEKDIQSLRQQSILQEIYFSREMLPDSPHEPDLELFTPQEPKNIPLDDDNSMGPLMDYSSMDLPIPKTTLPEVLTSLMNIPPSRGPKQHIPEQQSVDINMLHHPGPLHQQPGSLHQSISAPYDPAEPLNAGLLGIAPPPPQVFNRPVPEHDGHAEWRPMDVPNMVPPDSYFGGFPGNRPMMMDALPPPPPPPPPQNRNVMRPRMGGPAIGHNMYLSNMNKGPQMPRPVGPQRNNRHRVPCRHFVAGGCRFGNNCIFLHPGVNGPPL